MSPPNLTNKTRSELLLLAEATEALKNRYRERYIDFIMPSTGPYSRDKYYKAIEFFEAGKTHRFRMLGGANGTGKALQNGSLVYTATGIKEIQNLEVGDYIFGVDGNLSMVTGVFPQGLKECAKITFNTGEEVVASLDHLWEVESYSKKTPYIKTTQQIIDDYGLIPTGSKRYHLPKYSGVEFNKQTVPLDPYLLGLLLGDGCLSQQWVTISSNDVETVEYCTNVASEYNTVLTKTTSKYDYRFSTVNHNQKNDLTNILRHLNLIGTYSQTKFIPDVYKYNTKEIRLSVLQGLIDTDGSVYKGNVEYYTTSLKLAEDVQFLAQSLGCPAKISVKRGRYKGQVHLSYRVYFYKPTVKLTRLTRKDHKVYSQQVTRTFKKIELLGTSECTCISVNAPRHLFLTDGFVPTHNTFTGALEAVYHWTGDYPEWWKGKVQENPHHWWIISESAGTFKSSLQVTLLGPNLTEDLGTGLIPKDRIIGISNWPSVSGTVGSIQIRHKKGHIVTVEVKSFDQERSKLQGANLDGVLFDEEPPIEVYTECVFRLRGNAKKPPGMSMLLFTPLKGLSEVVLKYLPQGQYPEHGEHPLDSEKYVVRVDAEDVPHLSEEDKKAYLQESTEADRCARLHGLPAIGAGRVYPVNEADIKVNYLKIAPHWPRAYGMDFGWQRTAVIWGAKDPETGILYLYGEYYHGKLAPYQHVHAIKERGAWIPGLCDPRGDKGSERDGSKLIDEYVNLGLNLQVDNQGKSMADNAVNAGIARLLNMMESGLLKVTYNLENWFKEFRTYRYDMKDINKIAKNQDDHLMDATRYLVSHFDEVAISATDYEEENSFKSSIPRRDNDRNQITGY